jgi:hypothetical protein
VLSSSHRERRSVASASIIATVGRVTYAASGS